MSESEIRVKYTMNWCLSLEWLGDWGRWGGQGNKNLPKQNNHNKYFVKICVVSLLLLHEVLIKHSLIAT